jgi:hypothetical protein
MLASSEWRLSSSRWGRAPSDGCRQGRPSPCHPPEAPSSDPVAASSGPPGALDLYQAQHQTRSFRGGARSRSMPMVPTSACGDRRGEFRPDPSRFRRPGRPSAIWRRRGSGATRLPRPRPVPHDAWDGGPDVALRVFAGRHEPTDLDVPMTSDDVLMAAEFSSTVRWLGRRHRGVHPPAGPTEVGGSLAMSRAGRADVAHASLARLSRLVAADGGASRSPTGITPSHLATEARWSTFIRIGIRAVGSNRYPPPARRGGVGLRRGAVRRRPRPRHTATGRMVEISFASLARPAPRPCRPGAHQTHFDLTGETRSLRPLKRLPVSPRPVSSRRPLAGARASEDFRYGTHSVLAH